MKGRTVLLNERAERTLQVYRGRLVGTESAPPAPVRLGGTFRRKVKGRTVLLNERAQRTLQAHRALGLR